MGTESEDSTAASSTPEDHNRSGMYWTLETSITLSKMRLKFNICDLETSYVANKDVHNLTQKIKANIPSGWLIYSCLYWSTQAATVTSPTKENRSTLEVFVYYEFFRCLKVIHWAEVLSLVDGLKTGLGALQSVMVFFNVCMRQYICYQSIYNSHLS